MKCSDGVFAEPAAAEPAPERTPPQYPTKNHEVAERVCAAYGLVPITPKHGMEYLAMEEYADWREKSRAVAVPEPAAQQESEKPEIFRYNGFDYVSLNDYQTLRARQAEPAPTPSLLKWAKKRAAENRRRATSEEDDEVRKWHTAKAEVYELVAQKLAEASAQGTKEE